MKIIYLDYIEGTPARVNRRTGIIYVSKYHFAKIDKVHQTFIIYHEKAHYLFQTKDEEMCDEYAMMRMLKEKYKLSDILKSLTRVLGKTRAHHGRKINILNRLRIYDYLHNNNANALKTIQ